MSIGQIIPNELVLGSATIPGTIVFLALLLLFAWFLVFVAFVYRHYKRLALLTQSFSGAKPPMGELKKVKPIMYRQELRHYLGRIDTLMLKSKYQSPNMYLDELYHLVREFSIELLGIGHTYSDDELITIMSGHARELARLYWHITELRRHKSTVTKERFDSLLSQLFSQVSFHTKKKITLTVKAKSYINALNGLFRKKSELSPSENKIETLLTHEKASFESNLDAVKNTCNKILQNYAALPVAERVSMYSELMEFYHKVNDTLSVSLYGAKALEELKYFPRELVRIRDFNPVHEGFSERLTEYLFGKQEIQQKTLKDIKQVVTQTQLEVPKPAEKPIQVPRPEFRTPKEDNEILRMQQKIGDLEKELREPAKKPVVKQQPLSPAQLVKPKVEEEISVPLPKTIPVPQPSLKDKQTISQINNLMSKAVKIKRIDYITKIYRLTEKSRNALLKGNIKTAKAAYDSIKHNFVLLNEEEKKEVYPAITHLYNDLVRGVPPKVSKEVDLKSDLDSQERRLRLLVSKNIGRP